MPPTAGSYPTRDEALAYLSAYESRYALPVERPVQVLSTHAIDSRIRLETSAGAIVARAVIAATGSWTAPVVPSFGGIEAFSGTLMHSAQYDGPSAFAGKRVLVLGAGNSGAQIFADLVDRANVGWVTKDPPVFLPDDVDGQVLFDQATQRYHAIKEGRTPPPLRSLGDIVMVESLRRVRARGLLTSRRLFTGVTSQGVTWPDGSKEAVDAIILATGFKPALQALLPLAVPDARGRLEMEGLHAVAHPRLFPLGYGDWTGFASATIVGVGRAAKAIVEEITKS